MTKPREHCCWLDELAYKKAEKTLRGEGGPFCSCAQIKWMEAVPYSSLVSEPRETNEPAVQMERK
jgi:hypothetical protein